jgi:GNAT superfamily N-acetyltransferase
MLPVEAAPLERGQVAATARLLAAALLDDPAYAFIFGGRLIRRARLEVFFARHLGNHVPHRCSFVVPGAGGQALATVTLRPPGGIAVPAARMLAGLAALALTQGPGRVRRLLFVKQHYEGLEALSASGPRYWHVHMMAVAPELQGKGIGSALLEAALGTAHGPEPIVLTTHQAVNVRFYQRAGFRVVHEEEVAPPRGERFRVWCMRREAAATPRASARDPRRSGAPPGTDAATPTGRAPR